MSVEVRNLLVTKYGEKVSFQLDLNLGEDTSVDFSLHQHKVCCGFVDVKPVSSSHYALVCRACRLRVVIPNEFNTYKKLRGYLKVLRGGEIKCLSKQK